MTCRKGVLSYSIITVRTAIVMRMIDIGRPTTEVGRTFAEPLPAEIA